MSASLGLPEPDHRLYGRLVNLNIGPGFTSANTVCATNVAGCTPASQAGYPSSLIHGDPREIQPRIGYAWRPLTKGSLVIRGGYGIYYNTSVYQALVSQMSQQSPLSYSLIDAVDAIPPDARQWLPAALPHPHYDVRRRPEFPHRVRAKLADLHPGDFAVGAGRHGHLLRREGNPSGAGVHPQFRASGYETRVRQLPDQFLLHDQRRQHHREQHLAPVAAALPQRLFRE